MGPPSPTCRVCDHRLRDGARFCDRCGAATDPGPDRAEYKQVTVMFADVVRSMDIAAAVGAERLREIVTALIDRAATAIEHYGGTVGSFTGDGLMAVFGAPNALEDHAFRACLAALDVHDSIRPLAAEVSSRDGVVLELRIGLNSGQVIAGQTGSSALGYTTIGEHVGLAQRMESVAPPGGVALSETTARLVEDATVLGPPEPVRIKGSGTAVWVRRLLSAGGTPTPPNRNEPPLVGRNDEIEALSGLLGRVATGAGQVAAVVGPAGIGKSRLIAEAAQLAHARSVPVYSAQCESHTRELPYHLVADLLRAVFGIDTIDAAAARDRLHNRLGAATTEDLLLLNDLLGIGDPAVQLPDVTPDARQRRLSALLKTAAIGRRSPAVYLVEDVHWIDDASEAMLADLLDVVPRTRSLIVATFRPEYRGALSRPPVAHRIVVAPLPYARAVELAAGLLGTHHSLNRLTAQIVEKAGGNPFFTGEMVRDLAERGVLEGERGNYVCRSPITDIEVPATLQATIAARIDRLDAAAKRALYAAAVIGSRFDPDLLDTVLGGADETGQALAELCSAELVEPVRRTPPREYAFRHPLIRAVGYGSQLKSSRAELHRRVAFAIRDGDPDAGEQKSALVAEHFQAAGDLRTAFDWHMRAGGWSSRRDHAAARTSWQRARRAADALPPDDPDRTRLRIAALTRLCGSLFMAGGDLDDAGFDELTELCTSTGDSRSLAVGTAGMIMALTGQNRHREAVRLIPKLTGLLDAIDEPALTAGLLLAAAYAKSEIGQLTDALGFAERVIDLATGGEVTSPLLQSPLTGAIRQRGLYRMCLGISGWRADADAAIAMSTGLDPTSRVSSVMYKYILSIPVGARRADATALADTAAALRVAEQAGNDFTLALAQLAHGLVLAYQPDPVDDAAALLTRARAAATGAGFTMNALALVDPALARGRVEAGDLDGAIALARNALAKMSASGEVLSRGVATTVLVEALLERGGDGDLERAEEAIRRLALTPTEPGFVLYELPLLRLRAMVAGVRGDHKARREHLSRYRTRSAAVEFDAD